MTNPRVMLREKVFGDEVPVADTPGGLLNDLYGMRQWAALVGCQHQGQRIAQPRPRVGQDVQRQATGQAVLAVLDGHGTDFVELVPERLHEGGLLVCDSLVLREQPFVEVVARRGSGVAFVHGSLVQNPRHRYAHHQARRRLQGTLLEQVFVQRAVQHEQGARARRLLDVMVLHEDAADAAPGVQVRLVGAHPQRPNRHTANLGAARPVHRLGHVLSVDPNPPEAAIQVARHRLNVGSPIGL